MAAITIGTLATFGIPDNRPLPEYKLSGFPVGAKVKLRLRADEFAQAFARIPSEGIVWWYVKIEDGVVSPTVQRGGNLLVSKRVNEANGKALIVRRIVTPV